MNTTKKSLFRVLLITLCFIALGMFFQTGQSASLYSPEPLPTIEMTLRPGVDWVTVRNLSVEASTIWQENGQVFALSRPIINNARDAALYQELLEDRLNSLPDTQILTAEVTFKVPLSLTEVESLLGQTTIISLLASGNGGSTGQVAYPPDDIPAEFQDEFSQVFESLSGGTLAPNLSPDAYIAAKVSANALILRTLAHEEKVFTVDVGPVDLISDFPNGSFSSLKDVSYDYELYVGSVCDFSFLRNRIDNLSTNGEIPEIVRDELKDILINVETYIITSDIVSARNEMALFFETLTENTATIAEGALKEVYLIGGCLSVRKIKNDTIPTLTPTFTSTFMGTQSSTPSLTFTPMSTFTSTFTVTPSPTPTATFTLTPSSTFTATPSPTYTPVLYHFSGFFPPIDNQPTLNTVKAGSAVPVKFSLNGYQGLNIFAAGYPASAMVSCGSSIEDAIEQTATAGASSLSYDATTDKYIYVWKTDKVWAGTCRTFVLKLNDGSYHRADFKFKK